MMKNILCFFKSLTASSGVDGITVTIPENTYEFARGDNITLPCNFKPKPNFTPLNYIISWSSEADKVNAKEVRLLKCLHICACVLYY